MSLFILFSLFSFQTLNLPFKLFFHLKSSQNLPLFRSVEKQHFSQSSLHLSGFVYRISSASFLFIATAEMERFLWVGYCAFHLGNFEKSYEVYKMLVEQSKGYPQASQEEMMLCLSCSCFQLKRYAEAEDIANRISQGSDLKMRLLYLTKHQRNRALTYDINTSSSLEGQLSKAYNHYSYAGNIKKQ
jgi:hypothetical protein